MKRFTKNIILGISLLFIASSFFSCKNEAKANTTGKDSLMAEQKEDTIVKDSMLEDYSDEDLDNTTKKSLNDIRFEGWTRKDWLNNNYLLTLREYIDAYNIGKLECPQLDPYRKYLKSKFCVLNVEASLTGGLFVYFCFLDNPSKVFESTIYSNVEGYKVVSYEVRTIGISEDTCVFNKKEILEKLKEDPDNKLW